MHHGECFRFEGGKPAQTAFGLTGVSLSLLVCFAVVIVGKNPKSCGSEIRVQHDAVTGFSRFQPGEGFVNVAHWVVFGLRRDIVP